MRAIHIKCVCYSAEILENFVKIVEGKKFSALIPLQRYLRLPIYSRGDYEGGHAVTRVVLQYTKIYECMHFETLSARFVAEKVTPQIYFLIGNTNLPIRSFSVTRNV